MKPNPSQSEMSRRSFLKSAAVAGAGVALVGPHIVRAQTLKTDAINIAMIGVGTQGRVLLTNCLKIPGIQFKAVCDVWPYHRTYASKLLKKYKHEVADYEDYKEMLDKEKDIDAVLVATPDWVHAEHAVASLKAGRNVYCEKEMSNTLAAAKEMVLTSKQTGKLLQIGHQRRSNPRYHMALEYIDKHKVCGRITHVAGQWNRHHYLDRPMSDKNELDKATLEKYGYASMQEFRNWRQYKKFSQGPIADLGSHQIDIFHWFLHTPPKSVIAYGNAENYKNIEWYDDIMAIYEWDYKWDGETRTVGGHYQVCSTSSHGDFAETFMGTEGSMVVSEDNKKGGVRREYEAPQNDWEKAVAAATKKPAAPAAAPATPAAPKKNADEITVGHSVPSPGRYYPPIPTPQEPKTEHMPHLENFFDSVRGKAKLNCPGEVGYETCVSILKVNDAIEAGKKLAFTPEEFQV